MLPLGTPLPSFSLPDVRSDKIISSSSLPKAPAYLLMVICNHCPYVVHIRKTLVSFAQHAQTAGVVVLALSANDAQAYPADGPDKMREFAREYQFNFPYLYDEKQEVVKKLKAVCTPEFYLFDAERKLVYRGQMDDSRPGNQEPNNAYCLHAALNAVLKGEKVPEEQRPSAGCNIKWKKGNEPDYYRMG